MNNADAIATIDALCAYVRRSIRKANNEMGSADRAMKERRIESEACYQRAVYMLEKAEELRKLVAVASQ